MSTATQLLTADDLWNMPDHGAHRELVKGELRDMAPAGFEHGAVGMNLAVVLASFVRTHDLGVVTAAETGFEIFRDPDTVRAPDIGFVKRSRIPASGPTVKYWPGAPDLAVEVISPWDKNYEVDEKIEDWLTAGTSLVWVVNPRRKCVTVYQPSVSEQILTEADTLDGLDVVPGFLCPVKDIFA
ncbi:MAG: Uma2 family endonuclease [Planctomycetales bacterium]|nr:Uma2 family endonuclease [Planctomycetales bacterium]